MSVSERIYYYGSEEPLPEQFDLRAGPLKLIFEAGDLRYIKLDEFEVLRRFYWAVRDRNWGTPPLTMMNVQIEATLVTFKISYDALCQQGDIDFQAKVTITGDATGEIVFTLDGEANTTFQRNRLGFCVLHPATVAGKRAIAEHVDGKTTEAAFPTFIRQDQPLLPFAELSALTHEVTMGAWAEVRFEGDIFEMEDQRNWTDASFKTFCTPLRLPYPIEIAKGTKISQRVTLRIRDQRPSARDRKLDLDESDAPPVKLKIEPSSGVMPMPRLGLGMASHGQPLTIQEFDRLQQLHLAHLRVDLPLADPTYVEKLQQASQEAAALNAALEVALLLTENAAEELQSLRRALSEMHPKVCRWLLYPAKERLGQPSVRTEWIALAHEHLAGYDTEALFAAGTNTDFIFLNRTPPLSQPFDLLTLAINPQVHAADNLSMMETLEAQAILIESAQQIAGNKPVIVSPVTLKQRHNPYATSDPAATPPDKLPAEVDVRQMSLFTAAWTAISIKYLAESGVNSITYYETSGWRGVMEQGQGAPLPEKFRSVAGGVYPVYHVFADMGKFAGGEVIPTRSSDTLRADAITLQKGDLVRVLAANLTGETQQVHFFNLPGQVVRIYMLDEIDGEMSMRNPAEFRARLGQKREIFNGELRLELLPYGIACVDAALIPLPDEEEMEGE